jgi:hypothetical protein
MLRSNYLSRIRSSWRALPGWARFSAFGAVVLAAAGVCAFATLRGDPVERAVARGDLRAARIELRHGQVADAGKRSYDAGRVAEAQKSFRVAAMSYAAAARQGDERGLDRLVTLSHDRECPARSAAAAGMAKLRGDRALRALQQLREAKFANEGGKRKKHRAAVCDSRRAARDALKRARKA